MISQENSQKYPFFSIPEGHAPFLLTHFLTTGYISRPVTGGGDNWDIPSPPETVDEVYIYSGFLAIFRKIFVFRTFSRGSFT